MKILTAVITRILSALLVLLMAVIVLDVTWQVFSRFILRNPSDYTEELAGFLLIWIGLLGASYAYCVKAHLGIDVLTSGLSGTKRRISEILVAGIVLLFALFLLVIGGWRLVDLTFSLRQISPVMGIPMGFVYLVLPLTGILFMYYSVYFIAEALKKDRNAG
ncbi:MAG: TRAP transporter small permease [Acidobacteria bacterium]|nr:TRAP transporter small permease [Acidobacteriota bacterium]